MVSLTYQGYHDITKFTKSLFTKSQLNDEFWNPFFSICLHFQIKTNLLSHLSFLLEFVSAKSWNENSWVRVCRVDDLSTRLSSLSMFQFSFSQHNKSTKLSKHFWGEDFSEQEQVIETDQNLWLDQNTLQRLCSSLNTLVL